MQTSAGQSGSAPILRIGWAAYTAAIVSAIDSIQFSDSNFRTQMAFSTATVGGVLTRGLFIDSNQRVTVNNTSGGTGGAGFYNGVATGLTVFGSNNPAISSTLGPATLLVMSTDNVSNLAGASIGLGGRSYDYGGGQLFQTYGKISGVADATNGYQGALSFATMSSASAMTERMRIDNAGQVDVFGNMSITTPTTTPGQIILKSIGGGGSNIFIRNDGNAFYVLVGASTGSFNSLRPFNIRTSNGFISMGADTVPSYQLDVTGDIRATADIIAYSDVRAKTNIVTISNALAKVNNLRGVTYAMKTEPDVQKMGVIAQEVEQVIPEVVSSDTSPEQKKSVAYGNITAVLIEAIKELTQRMEALERR
jgi:hypothetical protein